METFTFILAFTAICIALFNKRKIKKLNDIIIGLEDKLVSKENSISSVSGINNIKTNNDQAEDLKPLFTKSKPIINNEPKPQSLYNPDPIQPKKEKKVRKSYLNWFLEQGAGMTGVLILVIGIAFLGVYSALTMNPFGRFMLIVFFSVLLFGGSYLTAYKMKWKVLSLWFRSAAGAIFLFSCVGAASINGLKWIDNPISGFIVILAGILTNMLLGILSQKETISSVHLLLSLVALAIAPPTLYTLIIGSIISIYGIYLTYRKKWDINLLIIITIFTIFHFHWNTRITNADDLIPISTNITALFSIVFISILTLFTHYREIYSVKKFELLPFITHFLNWCYLAVGIYLYKSIIPFEIVLASSSSIAALVIANRASKLNIQWLKITDTLVANLLMIIAVVAFYPKGVNLFFITGILILESIIFFVVVLYQKEKILSLIAYLITLFFEILLLVFNFKYESDLNIILLLGILVLSVGIYYFALKKSSIFSDIDKKAKRTISIIFPLIIGTIYINSLEQSWSPLLFTLLITIIAIGREKIKNNTLIFPIMLITTIVIFISWGQSFNLDYDKKLIYYAPLLILLGVLTKFSYNTKKEKYQNGLPIFLFALHYLVSTVIILPSSFYICLSWLSFIIITIYFSDLLLRKEWNTKCFKKVPEILFAIDFIILFFPIYIHYLDNLYLSNSATYIKEKYIIEGLTAAIMVFWSTRNGFKASKSSMLLKVNSIIIELLLIFCILIVLFEVKSNLIPVVLISLSIISLFIKSDKIKLYSIFISWITCITLVNESIKTKDWYSGLFTIILFCLYLILLRKRLIIETLNFYKYIYSFKKIALGINKHLNFWVYYPFFISTALYVLYTFSSNIITFFLVLLCLIIFIFSMLLKEASFKIISMVGLGGCLIRLILVDLSNSGTIARALVFIGVGLVLLLMNIIYKKFNDSNSEESITKI